MPRFRITVEPLTPANETEPLQFETENHDDIIAIARRMNGRFNLDEESSQSFAIGLKLLGEIVLKNRQRHPFDLISAAHGRVYESSEGGSMRRSGSQSFSVDAVPST